ncbi:uncharacterized protein M6B38_279005 [Iris pallida]|uniref:Uncharacterized protein n=1 Tax=Iris pallida TaxID=29817 RepID=A0AAX6HYM2_IRIPA|nr:uncharacterized protein M6B38_279005 [Iris pallida]
MEIEAEAPRRSRGCDASHDSCPEFEFWMVGNHPEHEPESQLTADELFVDGVLLPLHQLSFTNPEPEPNPDPDPEPQAEPLLCPPTLAPPRGEPRTERTVEEEPSSSIASAPITSSKRWKDIFKKYSSSSSAEEKEKEKSGKKERKTSSSSSGGGGAGAELNINIWPFSRSRSAGTAGGRPKQAAAMGKSSSAPCSRSNSRGERRWAASPGRPGGVHVGRVSPVWQVRRAGGGRAAAEAKAGPKRKAGGPGSGVRGLNLAPLNGCIGYRAQASCRGDEEEAAVGGGGGGANGSLFRLKGLFTKKVY